jgi:molecular chaperone GrpE
MFKNFKKGFNNMTKSFTDKEKQKKTNHSESETESRDDSSQESLKKETLEASDGAQKNEFEELKAKNIELEEKIKKCLYALSEKENDLRKIRNDLENQGKITLQRFIRSTGPAIDDLIRILEKSDDNALKMVFAKLIKAFEENKVFISMPKPGDDFDPEIHNAVSSVSNKELKNGTVVASMSASYKVFESPVLSAMVVVNDTTESSCE